MTTQEDKKKKHQRVENDVYQTPYWCIDGLFQYFTPKKDDVFLEPASGDGRIAERFPKYHECKWADIRVGVDYLDNNKDLTADVIITNPPFSLSMQFIDKALNKDMKTGGTVCMLLRLSMLGSKKRANFWRLMPPTHLITITPRPAFLKQGSDNSEYAWFCWDYGNRISCPSIWNIQKEEVDKWLT